jgi:hypothetical protein
MVDEILVNGVFVNAEVERVALAIKEYEPDIDIEWVPPGQRTDENGEPIPAFKLVHRPVGSAPYIMFFIDDESEFDLRVLQRIIYNDQRKGKDTYDQIRAFEEADRLVERQRARDELEEAEDMARHILATHLNTYKVSPHLVIKSGIPFNAKLLED